MAHEFAEVSFGLKEIWLCRYSMSSATFTGTPVSIDGDQMLTVEIESDTDDLRDSGMRTRGITVPIGAQFTLGLGAMDVEALAILTGAAASTSGTTPNRVGTQSHIAGAGGLPYFGLVGAADTDDGGVLMVGLKICKLNSVPGTEWDGKENKFSIGETEGRAFPDVTASNKYIWYRRYESEADWILQRPNNVTRFLLVLP